MTLALPAGFRWPNGFVWGAATAAAQVEGAAHEDGKRDSIWDAFARVPGNVAHGDTPERAVDHYHRMPEDVALMTRLGLDSYRFSVSWARVKPDDGEFNRDGLDFYSRLVDELLAAGILPWLTLYHWDLPQTVEETGGWANRDTAQRFLDYALGVHQVLGDRVNDWTTFNEPFCSSFIGYAGGEHAPGRQEPRAALGALHHQHLAHGLVVEALRGAGAARLGITLNLTNALPYDASSAEDLDAARRVDALWNRAFLEPILLGAYPTDFVSDVAEYDFESLIHDGDLATISQPIDFLGVNHYHDDQVSGRALPPNQPPSITPVTKPLKSPFVGSEFVTFPSRGLPRTAMGWEVNPDGLRILLERLTLEYPNLPTLYVTENGSSYDDPEPSDGHVADPQRVSYLETHIQAVAEAIAAGVDVRGYFAWSLMDNFEWAWGFEKRFGIVHVNYDTLERTVKDSGLTFAAIIAASRSVELAPKAAP
ncbi:MAG: GH1 family beta-glucosidase [Pseudolysinimonas sp.]|uniref:GH1 family beta-glucosidase n=1 Tax=Pseudolysinimonas sp. TaxID=2680009 RepID=UPI00326772D5